MKRHWKSHLMAVAGALFGLIKTGGEEFLGYLGKENGKEGLPAVRRRSRA
jgi:hypothetical protein